MKHESFVYKYITFSAMKMNYNMIDNDKLISIIEKKIGEDDDSEKIDKEKWTTKITKRTGNQKRHKDDQNEVIQDMVAACCQ